MSNPTMVVRVAANLDELRKNLAEGKGLIETTTAGMQKLATSLDGSRLEQRAHNIVAAITEVGGATRLTDAEARRHLSTLDVWIEKAQRMGKTVPDAMLKTRTELQAVSKNTVALNQVWSQFDSVLASVGVNVNTQVKALSEMAGAAGQTAGALGKVATAGLVVGTAMAAWQTGRAIADFFDLDKTIGDLTARLLGLGDVAGEEAAAKQDVLARASRIAGMEIKSMTLAVAINADEVKRHAAALNTSENRIKGWNSEISKVKESGNWDKLTADLKSQNFELKELAERYNVSVDALKYYTNEEKKAADAIEASNKRQIESVQKAMKAAKEHREEQERLFEAQTHLEFSQGNYSKLLAQTDPQLVQQIQHYKDLGLSVSDTATLMGVSESKVELVSEALERQNDTLIAAKEKWAELKEAQQKNLDEMAAQAQARTDAMKAQIESVFALQLKMTQGPSHTYDLSTDEGREEFFRMNPGSTLDAKADKEYFKNHTLQDAVRAGLLNWYGKYNPVIGGAMPMFADGVENFRGGLAIVGERGPELVNLPRGADVIPNHAIGGGVSIVVNVNGSLISDEQRIARVVGDAVLSNMRRAGVRFHQAA